MSIIVHLIITIIASLGFHPVVVRQGQPVPDLDRGDVLIERQPNRTTCDDASGVYVQGWCFNEDF